MRIFKFSVFCVLGLLFYALCYAFFWAATWFILYSFLRSAPRDYAHGVAMIAVLTATLSAIRLVREARSFYGPEESPLIGTGEHGSTASILFEHYGNRVTGTAYMLGQLFLAGPFCIIKSLSYL
jgi:hypothetical protein